MVESVRAIDDHADIARMRHLANLLDRENLPGAIRDVCACRKLDAERNDFERSVKAQNTSCSQQRDSGLRRRHQRRSVDQWSQMRGNAQ